ncbi:hypothetical protein F5X99DRAFT_374525 [Biscogniauxia marginata]|nr:hypothetical protein F5X99DRAFT_374525 [Biscogniauxia marginata]
MKMKILVPLAVGKMNPTSDAKTPNSSTFICKAISYDLFIIQRKSIFQRTRTIWFPLAEPEIAETGIAYLSYNTFGSGICKNDSEIEERLSSYPLYDYASRWGSHVYSALNYKYSKVNASSQALLL